ncbi:putative copine [Helianthus annuus]|uniref:Copine n=1 Tax=Helianthus annuus TaxID=4232 RepID=A0A9K3P163_HELAN|nr:putative copine [Helianthus annuus]KAJ0952844.1 putative copine [Helianthus annuus]
MSFVSNLPLSILLVGVDDGPWEIIKEFDDNIPSRCFDGSYSYVVDWDSFFCNWIDCYSD